jgi:hypothetical protein
MKKILLILTLFVVSLSYSQLLTFEEFEASDNQKKINLDSYQAKNGHVFKIGDKITIGQPSMNSDQYLNVVMNDLGSLKRLGISIKGFETEIKKFKIYGKKRTGYDVIAVTKSTNGFTNYWIVIEDAIKDGEIGTTGLNREQAIAKLKETKDLLDLGMINKEEYEEIKKELTPIIMNN